ncbi:MAG: hypothetical protein V1913_00980 [Fibrobacterota bacterium]
MRFLIPALLLGLALARGLFAADAGCVHLLYTGQSEATFGPCG